MGWAAFLLVAFLWIPILGPLFGMLTPLPFLYYSTKLGIRKGLKLSVLVVLTFCLLAKLGGYLAIVLSSIEFSLLGLILAELFRRKLGVGQVILFATVFMLLLGFGFLFFTALSKSQGPFEMMLNYVHENLDAGMQTFKEMGEPKENIYEIEAYIKTLKEVISWIYPSLMVISTGFIVWLNVVIAKPLFRTGNLEYPAFAPLDRWQAPEHMIWGVIVSGFAFFFFSGVIKLIAANALIIMMAIYLFHGLSIVLFFLGKYHIPHWIRVGVYALIAIQPIFALVLVLAGLFDQWIGFRKIYSKIDS